MSFARALASGPMEREVRALWKAYEENPIRSLRHLWRLWRFHNEFDISKPNPEEWSFTFPKGRVPDCLHCPDKCCRGPKSTVLLRLVDVALFVDRGWQEHMTLEKPSFTEAQLHASPKLRAMTSSFHWRVFPVLKQEADGSCTFLSQEGLCQIHEHRPWICRVFPYHLDIDRREVAWGSRCLWHLDKAPGNQEAKALEQAVFGNFYTEKVRDLLLVSVYPEELRKMGLDAYLSLP